MWHFLYAVPGGGGGPNFTKLRKDIGRSSLLNNIVSEFRHIAVFSNVSSYTLTLVLLQDFNKHGKRSLMVLNRGKRAFEWVLWQWSFVTGSLS